MSSAGLIGASRGWRRPVDVVVGILILAVLLFPVYWMVNVSLQSGGRAVGTPWFPFDPDIGGYVQALEEQGANLITSIIVSLGSVVFSLAVAAPAAYALAKFRSRWLTGLLFAILVSQMVPGIVVANALYSMYNQLGLLNSVVGLIIADSSAGIPFGILVMRAFMMNIPQSIVEAARVDGAGIIRTFWSIVLPVSRNALITAAMFTFLFTWGDFLFALTLTTTADVRPVTLGLYSYLGSYVNDWSAVMATAVLASIPAIAMLVAAQKFIAAGATGGAVK